MKVGILTVPFNNNYGGYLQAFALKTVVEGMDHEVTFINRQWNISSSSQAIIKKWIKVLFERVIDKTKYGDDNLFVIKFLTPITKRFFSTSSLRRFIQKNPFDMYIVGSDQVWRYDYAKTTLPDMFFAFLKNTDTPRFSYAASFGVDYLDYPESLSEHCSVLLKKFDGISVREKSGVDILKQLGMKDTSVSVVLDPTLLLTKEYYFEKFISCYKEYYSKSSKHLFCYVLDKSEQKDNIIKDVSKQLNIKAKIYSINGINTVENWLSDLYYADYVITDSYHGTVFSILFNKSFLVIGNKKRGLTRFVSLLEQLKLEKFCIDVSDYHKDLINSRIRWEEVNLILNNLRKQSLEYLQQHLS